MTALTALLPAAAQASSPQAGTSIGNAGVLDPSGSGTIAPGSDDWWLVYPAVPGSQVSVTVTNNGMAGSGGCGNDITVNLWGAQGTDDSVSSDNVPPETAEVFEGTSPSSDRYYVEVAAGRCNTVAPYTVKVTTAIGHPLIPPAAVGVPGPGLGSAWPPLHGHVLYTGHIQFAGDPENWYALSKKSDSDTATIRVQNTTVAGSTACGWINVTLQDSKGFGDEEPVASATLQNNSAATLTVPATGGFYYLWVTESFNPCHSVGGATYTVEPEPSGQFTSPSRAPAKKATPGTSIGNAWPPLSGGHRYTHTINFAGNGEDWYVLSKRPDSTPATIQVVNTTVDGSTACAWFNVTLQDSNGFSDDAVAGATLQNNSVATLTVPAAGGVFYLWITEAGDPCHHTGAANYTIEVEPGSQFTTLARAPSQPAMPATSQSGAWPPLRGGISYTHTLNFAGATQDWYTLTRTSSSGATTIRVVNTTVDESTACAFMNVYLDDNHGAADNPVGSATLMNNSAVTFSVPKSLAGDPQRRYYLNFAGAGDPCHNTGGATYTVELEPAAGWGTGARALPSGPSRATAGGPLAGGVNYASAVPTASSQDWAFLRATRAATVRVQDTSASSAGCKLKVTAGSSLAVLSGDETAALRIPKAGVYDIELAAANGCRPKSPLSALINLAGGIKGPALAVTDPTLKRGKVGKAYSATISVTGGKKPYAFAALTALPRGLHLSDKTGAITGRPAKAGTYTVMIKVTDSARPARNLIVAPIKILIT